MKTIGSLRLCENPRIGGSFISKIFKKNQNLEVSHKRSPNKSLVFKLILIDFGDIIVFFLYQSTCITKHIWKVVLHVDIQVVCRYSITQIVHFVYASA
jgi:hypothetical protein